jgi:hypothetical protein
MVGVGNNPFHPATFVMVFRCGSNVGRLMRLRMEAKKSTNFLGASDLLKVVRAPPSRQSQAQVS